MYACIHVQFIFMYSVLVVLCREERQNGYFDDSGMYVFAKERGEVDAWVANLDEAAMEKQIGESQRALQKKRMREAELDLKESMATAVSLVDVKNQILGLMNSDETVSKAMKRLSREAAELRKNKKPKVQKDMFGKPDPKSAISISNDSISKVNKLIELADYAISEYGLFNIYELSYAALDASLCMWEYRAPGGQEMHGPYSSEQIAEWKRAGYFTGATAVQMRKVPDTKQTKPKILDMFGDEETEDHVVESEVRSVAWISSDDLDFSEIISIPENVRKEQESNEVDEDEEESDHENADAKAADSDSDRE